MGILQKLLGGPSTISSIAEGGTGASTAVGARTNLSLYSIAETNALIGATTNERAIWGYQDFLAGAITSTSVTLAANSNGVSAIFDPVKLINSSASLFRQDGISYAFTGSIALFSSKVTVVSQVGSAITLSGIPHASWGTLRIWYQIKSTVYPQDYTNPPLTVQDTVIGALGALFEEEENKAINFTTLNDVLYPSVQAVENRINATTVTNNSQSGSIAATATSGIIIYEFTGAGSLTLPTAVANKAIFMVKNRHSANITVTFTSGQNADASTSISISPYQALQFISNNANYNIF